MSVIPDVRIARLRGGTAIQGWSAWFGSHPAQLRHGFRVSHCWESGDERLGHLDLQRPFYCEDRAHCRQIAGLIPEGDIGGIVRKED
jgi:hypothetical protein